jgi:coproporphyrinogen III oxidase
MLDTGVATAISTKDKFIQLIHQLQETVCSSLESCDGGAVFTADHWQREGGGGGITKVLKDGSVFEKAGVNTSVVYGQVTETMEKKLGIKGDGWFACGISSVIHPKNPFVPTVHFNYRYFELYGIDGLKSDCWFGGGIDLTPYYLFEEDAKLFHQTYKAVCDGFDKNFYAKYKQQCDNYFVNKHRNNERRGIGGIFYDYERPSVLMNDEQWLHFSDACGSAFLQAYLPIVERRAKMNYAAQQKYWQEIRRGRYVEFNLVHDRGTLFGLHTNGRTESILISLPPTVRFDYDFKVLPGSDEEKLLRVLMQPMDWIL